MISLCSMCMNRGAIIRENLKTWTQFPFDEIVVLDWSSNPPLEISDKRVKLLRIEGKEYWEMNTARNNSIMNSKGDIIMLVDCDVKILKDPTKIELTTHFFHGNNLKQGLVGTCMFKREWFDAIGGYNENIKYYGKNAQDFYSRLMRNLGLGRAIFEDDMLDHLNHGDDLRIANMNVKSKRDACWLSLRQSNNKWNSKSVKETLNVIEVRG